MRKYLGKILDALPRLPLDPCRRDPMPTRALGSGNLRVGDVANEDVPKGVLTLAVHRRRPRRSYELLSCELVQCDLKLVLASAADLRKSAGPEDVADDGGILQQALPLVSERVQPRGDQRMDAVRQPSVVEERFWRFDLTVGEETDELLGIEWVPACQLEHRALKLIAQLDASAEV